MRRTSCCLVSVRFLVAILILVVLLRKSLSAYMSVIDTLIFASKVIAENWNIMGINKDRNLVSFCFSYLSELRHLSDNSLGHSVKIDYVIVGGGGDICVMYNRYFM